MSSTSNYPAWICQDCGMRWGNQVAGGRVVTWHPGRCGICQQETAVTEPRDFGHLNQEWREKNQKISDQ